jgi:hypothetical protein
MEYRDSKKQVKPNKIKRTLEDTCQLDEINVAERCMGRTGCHITVFSFVVNMV